VLWRAEELADAVDIKSVSVVDLDSDRIPEIITLWRYRSRSGARLRIFHWDPSITSFRELRFKGTPGADSLEVDGYSVIGKDRKVVRTVAAKSRSGVAGRFVVEKNEIVPETGQINSNADSDPSLGSSAEDSGIEGQAVIQPVRPGPVREGHPPSKAAYQTTLVVYAENDGHEVARVDTGADGRFKVSLPPGRYIIGPPRDSQRRLPRGMEVAVEVLAGRHTTVTVTFDSGMR
jgi:hypothetical protein